MAYIYMVLCSDDSIYTGITKDLEKRMKAHISGKGAKYTRSHTFKSLLCAWQCESYNDAAKLEYAIKHKLTKKQKTLLAENPETVNELFGYSEQICFEVTDVKRISIGQTCLKNN